MTGGTVTMSFAVSMTDLCFNRVDMVEMSPARSQERDAGARLEHTEGVYERVSVSDTMPETAASPELRAHYARDRRAGTEERREETLPEMST